jgi:hypothetical protein
MTLLGALSKMTRSSRERNRAWVLLALGDEQHLGVLGVQHLPDGVLPLPLPPVRQRLAPAVISVNRLIPQAGQLPDRLARP